MQKIEQVMPDLSVILPAPQNLLLNFQKHDLLIFVMIFDDSSWIHRSCFFSVFSPRGRPLVESYMIKKHHIMDKIMIFPIKSGAFGHEELFKNTPGASNYHKR